MRPDGKSKGMAFVRFSKKSALQKALDLNGT
jgi:RNA recognition motif-containing protein